MVTERSVLHVLPHPGGGGETYVDLLADMPGHRFTRVYLAPNATPSPRIARGVFESLRAGPSHELVHVHGEVAAGLCLPLLVTRASVVTLHGLHLVRRLRAVRRQAAALNLRAVVRAADRTICVSQTEQDELRGVVGSTAERAIVIRNGVRLPLPNDAVVRAAVREELDIDRNEPVGIWIGSLDERKDPLAAIRAAGRAEVTLLMLGDGPLRSKVARRATAHARVLGYRADVSRVLAAADFYVSTSRREGLALSLLEAMAHGLAPIVTDLPENVEGIGDAGIAVSVGDEEALVAAVRRLAERPAELASLGERARQRVADLFNAEEMVARTRAVYEAVVDRRS